MDQRLAEFFEAFFGINIKKKSLDKVSFPTFEEILGILELALNREESFKGYSLTPDKPRIQRIREDLIFLIAIILDEKLQEKGQYHRLSGKAEKGKRSHENRFCESELRYPNR